MIVGGVIVYSELLAVKIAKLVDSKVDNVFVDAEKKIKSIDPISGRISNIERAVRENLKKSNLFVYKGNDLTVEAVDNFLSFLFKDYLKGLGGKKITIIGAGNIGSKLALKLVERGAQVIITRRNENKLKKITEGLNAIKSSNTIECISYTTDNEEASKGSEIIIGSTAGTQIISVSMIKNMSSNKILIDIGKGTFSDEAINYASNEGINIYRIDVSTALTGLIEMSLTTENNFESKIGRREVNGMKIVSGGLLGREGELVVNEISKPSIVYGIADGKGDFKRVSTNILKKYEEKIKYNWNTK